jgi:hypothetical protein
MGSSQSSTKIAVAVDKSLYNAGEVVRGYVQVTDLQAAVALPDITVTFIGSAITSVRYSETTGSGENKQTVQKTATQNHTLVKLDTKVGQVDSSLVRDGVSLQWPFEFAIPADATSSMPPIFSGSGKAEITYSVSVHTSAPGKLWGTSTTCVKRVELDVVAAPPVLTVPPRIQTDVKVMRCCCIPAGRMQVAVASSLSAYKMGDNPQVTYEVSNESSQDVSYVTVSLVRSVHWRAEGHGSSSKTTIVSTKQHGVPIGGKFGFQQKKLGASAQVGPEDAARSVDLEIPSLAYVSTSTPTITCAYSLRVKVKTESAFVRDPEVHLAISTYRLDPCAAAAESEAGDVSLLVAYEPNPAITVCAVEIKDGDATGPAVLMLSVKDVHLTEESKS